MTAEELTDYLKAHDMYTPSTTPDEAARLFEYLKAREARGDGIVVNQRRQHGTYPII